ncbi:hypothetical protein [Streptomyces flavofungini]|uniref:hypothetical protein n=1 Tax=Streptomyces flavofungini TaxID=68200 RepID=UPI0025AFF2CA|nr:hypothetical protein [Streptomyces flavofungini]WJV51691.1 hypothetical protein QUY26_40235 [Streptomyces flavofungini]
MTAITESVSAISTPVLTENGPGSSNNKPIQPVTFTPTVLALCPYAGAGLAAGAATVGAYEAGRAAGAGGK